MLCRTLRRSLLDSSASLPQTYILPVRALSTQPTSTSTTDSTSIKPQQLLRNALAAQKSQTPTLPSRNKRPTAETSASQPIIPPSSSALPPDWKPENHTPTIHESVKDLLVHLRAQRPHYITIHLHGHPYLVQAGDTLRLPFLMPNVSPGDTLRLTRATHIGSRDFTLRAAASTPYTRSDAIQDKPRERRYLDERMFVCRARVMGVMSEPMRIMEKTKRRQRHVKHVWSKHRYTVLRISELSVRSLEEVEALKAGGETVVERDGAMAEEAVRAEGGEVGVKEAV